MLCKYGKQTRDFGAFLFLVWSDFLYFGGVFNKTIIPFALVGYKIGNSQLGPTGLSLAIYHLISNKREWKDNCQLAKPNIVAPGWDCSKPD